MAAKEITILVCLIALVVAEYPEPPKKQKGYEYKEHKEYHSLSKKNDKHPDPYEPRKDSGYQREQYGKVSVKKYGYKNEYGNNERKDSYHEPRYGHESNEHDDDRKHRSSYEPSKHEPHGYGDKHSSYKPREYHEKPHGYGDNQYDRPKSVPHRRYKDDGEKYGPAKHEGYGYHEKSEKYETYKPHGYEEDGHRNEPHGKPRREPHGYHKEVEGYKSHYVPEKPHGHDDETGYQSEHPGQYKPREEKKYYKGYHKEEYYHNDKKGYHAAPSYKPKKNQSVKKVVYEKHYYGKYGKQDKPERALGGFESDLHTPVFDPHRNGGYHGNVKPRQLRGYEAALARQKYYHSAANPKY